MSIGSLKQGYLGILKKDATLIRVSSFGMNPEQELKVYPHTLGLRDSIDNGIYGGKGDNGFQNNPQNAIIRAGVISYTGPIAFPITEDNSTIFFEEAKTGDDFDIDYVYNCEIGRSFSGCKINQYSLSCEAGEIAQLSVDIMATEMDEASSVADFSFSTPQKLITWDKCSVIADGISSDLISSFSLEINNNCEYVYTSGHNNSNKLKPKEIRCGIQDVKGEIVFYNKGSDFSNLYNQLPQTITITVDNLEIQFVANYMPPTRTGDYGVTMTTIPFMAVGVYWT